MVRTIPRRLKRDHIKGDYRARCDYCGAMYHRSMLTRKEGGLLACPDDVKGRDEVELSRLNSEHAASVTRSESPFSGGSADTRNLPVIHRTTADDIENYDGT